MCQGSAFSNLSDCATLTMVKVLPRRVKQEFISQSFAERLGWRDLVLGPRRQCLIGDHCGNILAKYQLV
jgi:hypothetical protein